MGLGEDATTEEPLNELIDRLRAVEASDVARGWRMSSGRPLVLMREGRLFDVREGARLELGPLPKLSSVSASDEDSRSLA